MKTLVLGVGALLSVSLCGCGKELGRIPFSGNGTATASVPLAAGDVAFWTDIDAEFSDNASLTYTVELEQGGKKVASASCNPFGNLSVKTTWVSTDIGGKHTRSGSGKMDCTVKVPAGTTTVKATLTGHKVTVLRKGDLVIKQ